MIAGQAIRTFWISCLLVLCSISALAQSQTTGRISGTVKDPNGAVIAGAEVTVKSLFTDEERTVATDAQGMIREGKSLATIDDHVVVKVPFGREGVKACKALSGEGIPVNVTLCFSATQALLAAKVGASYISPFVGRLDDIATDGMHLIEEIVEIYDNYEFGTEVLVASTRHPIHIVQAARLGADICTCPPAVLDSLFKHPLTDIGLEKFLKDWEKAQAQTVAKA